MKDFAVYSEGVISVLVLCLGILLVWGEALGHSSHIPPRLADSIPHIVEGMSLLRSKPSTSHEPPMLTPMQQRDPCETTKSAYCRPCRAALRGPPILCMPSGGGAGGGGG